MKVPCAFWPEAPCSPVGYQVVVTDEKVPGAEADSQPDRPTRGRETTRPPLRPWTRAGYRVVEAVEDEVVEGPSPAPTRPRSAGSVAAKGPPPRKFRLPARWVAVAGVGSFLLAAVALVLPRLSAWTRDTGDHAVAVEENSLRVEPRPAVEEDGRVAAREMFGTAVGFVRSPAEAARVAAREQKLTFLLHVSGNFDDPGLT
jgi:hypothetical protein